MALKEIVEAFESELDSLDFKPTEEVFDFEAVPASVIDRAYRIENTLIENRYFPADVANRIEQISVFVAYRIGRTPRATWKKALEARETIEKAIYASAILRGLGSDPLPVQDGESSTIKVVGTYVVLRIDFSVNFLDSLT